YRADVFDRASIEALAGRYVRLLQAAVATPEVSIGRLELLSGEERRTLLQDWNATARALEPQTVAQLFAAQAAQTPDAVAVVFEQEALSYAQLEARANRLAQHLRTRVVELDSEAAAIAAQPSSAPASAVRPQNLAYVIYTSGSTGTPKGVAVTHGSLANVLLAMREQTGVARRDRLMAVTTLAFDISALELFLPLISGAGVAVAPREIVSDPRALARMVEKTGTNLLQAMPTLWHALTSDGGEGLQSLTMLVGGESLTGNLSAAVRDLGRQVTNLYGPTETTIWSVVKVLDDDDAETPPIGRPIWNTRVYVLDSCLEPVPVGVVGEVYISGSGVGGGYLGRGGLAGGRLGAE